MSEEQYLIRPFKLEDKESVVELWKICRLTRPWNNPEKDIERKLNVQSEMFLVLEIEGSIKAFTIKLTLYKFTSY